MTFDSAFSYLLFFLFSADPVETHRIYAAIAEASDLDLQNFTKQIKSFINVSPETEWKLVTAIYELLNIDEDGDKFERAVQNYTDLILQQVPDEDLFNKLDEALKFLISVPLMSGFKKEIAGPVFKAVGRFLYKIKAFKKFADKWAATFSRSTAEMSPKYRVTYKLSKAMESIEGAEDLMDRFSTPRWMRSKGGPLDYRSFDTRFEWDQSILSEDSLIIEGEGAFDFSGASLVSDTGEPAESAIAIEPAVLQATELDVQVVAKGLSNMMMALGGLTSILSLGMLIFETYEDTKTLAKLDAQENSVEGNTQRYFRKVYEQFSPTLGGCSECADGKYCCSSAYPNGWNSLCDGCSEAISAPSAFQCASDFGSDIACCDQGGAFVPPEWQCPQSAPTCVNYLYGYHMGNCAVECASDFDSDIPCCDQGGGTVPPKYQCPESLPTCVNYVFNDHYGTCVTAVPFECADIGDDVYDPTKFSKVPTNCCTGAAAILQDGKYLCPCRGLNICYDCASSGSNVRDRTKYAVVPAVCCSSAPAVQNICS